MDTTMLTRDHDGAACLGGVRLADVLEPPAAESARPTQPIGEAPPASSHGRVRTPAYVYDLDGVVEATAEISRGFGAQRHLVAYAVKANSAGAVLRALAAEGAGAEVVSGAELTLALACGFPADRILYSGVGKTSWEIDRAIGAGERGILALQIESVEEIGRVAARARALGRHSRVSLRINPGVAADTHAHVATGHDEAKFGIAREDLDAAWQALELAPELELTGLSYHVGSQLRRTDEYVAAANVLVGLAMRREAAGGPLSFLDFGGGFAIDYDEPAAGERRATPGEFTAAIAGLLSRRGLGTRLAIVEPGRALVGAHGVLCATVIGAKRSRDRRWLLIDAGMNDLIRPALYAARHRIEPLDEAPPRAEDAAPSWRVAGPVCESSDDFGEHRFAEPPPGRVIIRDAGAYGFVMACEYNGRALPAEVFVRGGAVRGISATRHVDTWVAERAAAGG
jgi:diaminopimelate decarboxylase